MVAIRHLNHTDKISAGEPTRSPAFVIQGETNMNPLLLIIGVPVGLYILWFVIEFIRYLASGEYDVDKRLRKVTR